MPRQDFRTLFPNASVEAVNLIERMLVLDPDNRITVEQALRHEYVKEWWAPEDEPVADHQVCTDAEEEQAVSLDDWREIIWREIQMFRASDRRLSCFGSVREMEEAIRPEIMQDGEDQT